MIILLDRISSVAQDNLEIIILLPLALLVCVRTLTEKVSAVKILNKITEGYLIYLVFKCTNFSA